MATPGTDVGAGWPEYGPSHDGNRVTLCRCHHRSLHLGEFTVDQNPVFRDRCGVEPAKTFTPVYITVQKLTKSVSYETCRTQWSGEAVVEKLTE